jgi:N-acetylglutamate synthase-like GNAT family acetyltransferase
MPKIRKAKFSDKFKLKKLISFLSSDEINLYTNVIMSFPCNVLHSMLPLKLKFLPESYVIHEHGEILGMVTVEPVAGNPCKLLIKRLFLEQNCLNAGKQLIEFVIAKYGAKGAYNFYVTTDDRHDELLDLFINGCGFRQCSTEELWRIENKNFQKTEEFFIRPFKNSDSEAVANLFNDSVLTPFKHSVSRVKKEYYEPFFSGLSNNYKLKYVIEDDGSKAIKAYFSIMTTDNENYIADFTISGWYDCSYESVFAFLVNQISKRQKKFNLFIKLKKYVNNSDKFEKYLQGKGFERVNSKAILTKDFYRPVKLAQESEKVVLFNEISGKPVFKAYYEKNL